MKRIISVPIGTAILTTAGGLGYFSQDLPNSVFLDDIQKVTQLYKNAVPVPLSPNMQTLVKSAMEDMKIDKDTQKNIRFFTCSGFEFFVGGSIWTNKYFERKRQSIIGIPVNFNWDSINDEEKKDIVVQAKSIDWSSEPGKQLQKSLLFSDCAKKYAVAQNLFYASQPVPLINGIIVSFFSVMSVFYILQINHLKLFQYKQFRKVRYGLMISTVMFNIFCMMIAKDLYQCNLEEKADHAIASLNKSYIEGGCEYFNKILSRNAALRAISGKKSKFSILGNEDMVLRQKHLPIVTRKDFFEKKII